MIHGPKIIVDKSTLQGMNYDNSQYISRYYTHLVTPILLRELRSGITKEDKKRSDAELKNIVKTLALKTNSPHSFILPDAHMMAYNDLMGNSVPVDGRIPIEHGISLNVPGLGKGIHFQENPQVPILQKWVEGNFSPEDFTSSKAIRDEDKSIDFVSIFKNLEKNPNQPNFTCLQEMADWADEVHFSPANPEELFLNAANHVLGYMPEHFEKAIKRWKEAGCPKLQEFAPYALHYYRVDVIVYLSLLHSFVSRSKHSKIHLDAQYLYYLPFCHIFSTDDKELEKLVPYFINSNQRFIKKDDLKKDLNSLSEFFTPLSDEETKAFRLEYGRYPPNLENSFTAQMWEQFMRPKRPKEGVDNTSPEEKEKILKDVKAINEALDKYKNSVLNISDIR